MSEIPLHDRLIDLLQVQVGDSVKQNVQHDRAANRLRSIGGLQQISTTLWFSLARLLPTETQESR
jgi:hypothetical protein